MFIRYKKYNHSVGGNLKHIQITTKYRCKILWLTDAEKDCENAIRQVCKRHKIDLKIINVQEDHVHMIVDCPRTISDSKLMQLIKGGSSYLLFRAVPELRYVYPKGHLWSSGYFCTNIGGDYEKVFTYIKNQNIHHA